MSVLFREFENVVNAVSKMDTVTYHLTTNENDYNLEIPMIGIGKEDVNVEVKDNLLVISAKTKSKSIFSRDYGRSFKLEKDVDADSISAKLENGILSVVVPKAKHVKKTVSISVI